MKWGKRTLSSIQPDPLRAPPRTGPPHAATFLIAALLLSPALLSAHSGQPGTHLPGEANFYDPASCCGISYDWTMEVKRGGIANVVGNVGATSWREPKNPVGHKGNTERVQWIALDLLTPGKLLVILERQQGALYGGVAGGTMARGELTPALTLYRGWDESSDTQEEATFDTEGDFWSTVTYLDSEANQKGKARVVFRTRLLEQGRYTLAIGGNPPPLSDYPAADCDAIDPVCYAYTGRHGYELVIQAK